MSGKRKDEDLKFKEQAAGDDGRSTLEIDQMNESERAKHLADLRLKASLTVSERNNGICKLDKIIMTPDTEKSQDDIKSDDVIQPDHSSIYNGQEDLRNSVISSTKG